MKAVAGCRGRGSIEQCLFGLLALVFISIAVPAGAAAGETQAVRQIAPVRLANRTIIELHGPVAGVTAERRAQDTMERIDQALDSEMYPQVTLEEMKDTAATRVLMGGKSVFVVAKLDIDESAGETTLAVADEARKRLEQAIRERREQQTPRYLAMAAAYAASATLLFGAALWLLLRASRWIRSRLADAAVARSEKLQFGGVGLLDSSRVLVFTRRVSTLLTWAIAIVLTVAWLTFVLRRFPYTRPWGDSLRSNLADLLGQVFTAVVESIPGLFLLLVIFVIARTVIRVFAVFFDRAQQGRVQVRWIDAETAGPTRYIFNFIVCAFALAIAYPYLPGADTEAFKGISVLLGVMVSIGGASVIGQAFSGLILMYMRVFRRGDYVRGGDNEGTVVDLGIFATRIRTGLGEEITVPNSEIMSTATMNYSRAASGAGYVVDTKVTIGYSTPWRQVQAMLLEAAKRTRAIASTPSPFVRQTALSDFHVEYRLVACTPVEHPALRIDVLSQLHENIQDVFNEYGVQIMTPNYEADPPAPQVVPKEQWYAAPARPPDTWRSNERLLEQS